MLDVFVLTLRNNMTHEQFGRFPQRFCVLLQHTAVYITLRIAE